MWHIWLITAGIFFIIEIITTGFLVFWFGIGALITMIFSFFIPNVYIQSVIFIVSSTLLMFFTKPLVNKFLNNKKTVATNANSIIGKKGIVIKEINSILGTGQIKINGEVWSAKTESDEIIPENSEVEVIEINGVKAVVKNISKVVK